MSTALLSRCIIMQTLRGPITVQSNLERNFTCTGYIPLDIWIIKKVAIGLPRLLLSVEAAVMAT